MVVASVLLSILSSVVQIYGINAQFSNLIYSLIDIKQGRGVSLFLQVGGLASGYVVALVIMLAMSAGASKYLRCHYIL